MRTKLLIVNNGLRDLRGHYFETGVSVAEAAAAAGLETHLFVHAECDPKLLETAPDIIPLCRTDHWMSKPPVGGPQMRGIRCDPGRGGETRIEDVIAGRADLRSYLLARFEPPAPPERNRALRALLPPVGLAALRLARRSLRLSVRAVKTFGRRLVPPILQPRARSAWRGLRQFVRGPSASCLPRDTLQARLARAGRGAEFKYVRVFQEDLARALTLTGAGPGDHVFLPTAHGRELAAIRRLVEEAGADRLPTFHLEFRHALEFDDDGVFDPIDPHDAHWLYVYTALHRVYFDWCRRLPLTPSVRVYTDTDELSEAYARFSGLPFQTLPIPFRTERIADRTRRPDEPICLAYLGDARDEKGFAWLPPLVRMLQAEAEAGRVRFLFQASLDDRRANRQSVAALRALRKMAAPYLELSGLDRPLSPEEYFELVSAADVILCPYSPETYQRRSSGTLTEGIAAGVPTVVPAGTWLERQQPPGTGTSFADLRSFLVAVRELVADYPRFAARARAHRNEWRAVHSPANLVRTLTHPPAAAACAA